MADTIVHDVVNQSLSVGDLSPSDATATTTTTHSNPPGDVDGVAEVVAKENGLHTPSIVPDLDDVSAKSDTDGSRAEDSVAGDKLAEPKPLKKFTPAKPVSFAKYSVPKVIAANAAAKGADKAPTPTSSTPTLQLAGRPRLVAKTTSSLQQNAKAFKPAAPDPMQVWNKNRVTPQPSTKHLTDEELKQQYGIHLTSRLEADADGKEAKWADIDDDEDDWAPETIEWNDGTKTTLTAADLSPVAPVPKSDPKAPGASSKVVPERPKPPQFTSSVGPNATVLKIGANAEKQQAQKALAEKTRTPLESSRSTPSNVIPAAAPAKSPWAVLPPVDKASPVEINPQPMMPLHRAAGSYGMPPPPVQHMHGPSPAKEMSADDFNRSWKDGSSTQPQQLYMPNSNRYEAVSDSRRRMSRNDQGFRAPAVLQRPSASESQGPAEPSAAFQTTRTSSDATRRRASSIVSGGSGQFARRLSMKSGDYGPPVFDNQSADLSARPISRDGPITPIDAPQQTYSAINAAPSSAGPAFDLEAEREKQKQMMKESGIRARQRRLEEEAKLEAEKKERIRKKLEALEAAAPAKKEEPAKETIEQAPVLEAPRMAQSASQSPPKPPQPLATGEPQQYGMIKVHALDSTKRMSSDQQRPFTSRESQASGVNGIRPVETQRPVTADQPTAAEPSPKLPKPMAADARSGWGDLREHRPQAANLWGISSNKALGNGTFDQTLAGYAPQDLSRASSGAPGWNGRTPVAGRSPHIPEAKLPLASPDQGPLAADSEADTLFPVVPPAPIGRPHHQGSQFNGGPVHAPGNNTAAWNNFHQTALTQERAENEIRQREVAARREEEQRTGVRQGPQYTFNETWKQVQIGDNPTQRQVAGKTQSSIPASFGAVGSLPNGPAARNSRFFPSPVQPPATEERRAVTYSCPQIPRSPSPPPAEEYASAHPAFDGNFGRPAVRFPRERPVIKLPPGGPPTPPAEPEEEKAPLTWAARAAMAAQPQRSASMPTGPTKWQERFNGLLGRSGSSRPEQPVEVESISRDSLDLVSHKDFSVSLPSQIIVQTPYATKEVESEEDLFEDRELGFLPTINLPLQSLVSTPLSRPPRYIYSNPLDIKSAESMDTEGAFSNKAQHALIHLPGMTTFIRKDLIPSNGHQSVSKPRGGRHGPYRGHGARGGRRGVAKAS